MKVFLVAMVVMISMGSMVPWTAAETGPELELDNVGLPPRSLDANSDNVGLPPLSLDANSDGIISKDEMATGLAEIMGMNMSDKCWNDMLEVADKNGDGLMAFTEIQVAASTEPQPESCTEEGSFDNDNEPEESFPPPSLDANTDGIISKDEMATGLAEITGMNMSDNCWNAMLEVADKNGDGKMAFTEFQVAVSTEPPPETCTEEGLFV